MQLYLFGGLFGMIGVIMLLIAVKNLIENINFLRTSERIEAKCVSFVTSYNNTSTTRHGRHRTMYRPVLEFQPPDAEKAIRITAQTASHPPAYNIGELAEVRYLAKNPHGARLNLFWELWLWTSALGFLGPALMLFAYVIFTQQ